MAAGKRPTIFVSSTCYDLRQVRADLRPFLESLGCEALLSEFNSFPVDPGGGAVANCIEVVKGRADILVLVVGGRYGSLAGSGKSVTNLEYLEARSKKIPVFVFVQESILSNLPIWRSNPSADFSTVVDSPKLFEFVASLMDNGKEWVFTFKAAQDIAETLRIQIAYLLMDGLSLISKISESPLPAGLLGLTGKALRLVLEQPREWKSLLFSRLLNDGIDSLRLRKREIEWEIGLGTNAYLTNAEVLHWTNRHVLALLRIVKAISQLFSTAFDEAMSGDDLEKLVYVARRIVDSYSEMIEWVLDCSRVIVSEQCEKLLQALSRIADQCIKQVEWSAKELQNRLDELIRNGDLKGKGIELALKFSPDFAEFHAELNRLKEEGVI